MAGELELSVAVGVLMLVAAVASYGFAWYSWRRASHPISDRFALLMVADGSWALFALLGHVSLSDASALWWRLPFLVAVVFAGPAWFLFVIDYTADSQWIPPVVERALLVVVGVFALLFAVNPGGLAYSGRDVARYGVLRVPYETFGPLLQLQVVFNYLLVAVAFALLGRFMLRSRNLFRKQAAAIFAAAGLATLATVAFFAGLTPHPRLDLTPIFFTLQSIGVGVALYRYDFLNVEPMAAHTLLEEMADPVVVVDSSDRLVDWNGAAAAYIEPDDGRMSIDDIRIPELAAALTATDGGSDVAATTVTTTTPDGRERVTFDVRMTPIEDRYGIVRGRAVVLRDITEQERRKRALETQNERLEEFTGVVSHDLRNPLQVIDSRIELARRTGDLSHLDDAGEATRRMEALLDDLLELAREGQVLDETSEVDLADCVRRAWGSIETPEATLTVDTDRVVVADESRLRQVFENLFRNAVEHGGEDVGVTVTDTDEGFVVADGGSGVPPEERDGVFDLGRTSETDGTGFGLAIVKRVVEAHGWSIAVGESVAGGASFTVSLAEQDPPAVDG